MELEEIKEIARKEKGRDLRPIANDFYEQAEAYVPPAWFGRDVTYDPRYHNSVMSKM